MQLIVCEKPSVAQKIAEALADGNVKTKNLHSVKYYEFEHGGMEIAVAPAVGHIYSLQQKTKSRGYPVFDIEWVPSHKVNKSSAFTKAYLKTLSDLGGKADECISACDYDIEGSLIGYNAIRFAAGKKTGKRMKFSTVTQDELLDAYKNAGPLDLNNALAGEARHMLDWFYGINLSRALMYALSTSGIRKVMSIGRVQGPSLKILGERERKISEFKPESYWILYGLCKKAKFEHHKKRFTKKEEAQKALENSAEDSKISKVTKKPYMMDPNPPFDLTSLQVEAYRVFKIPPAQTLKIAQTLYENSLISYPRTSSQKLPPKLNLPKILNSFKKHNEYGPLAEKLISEKRFAPFQGKKSDPAHPAIHPTGIFSTLGSREMKIYDLIARRFLAVFAPKAKLESQKVELMSNTEKYLASGTTIVEKGWTEYYGKYTNISVNLLPPFEENEDVKLKQIKLEEKETKPPKRYTPASLISTLEKYSLGTKATRSTIVETLFKRGYLEGKSITVTPFGMSVLRTLEKNSPQILDAELTRKIEEEMEGIRAGKVEEEKVLEEGKKILKQILSDFKEKERQAGSMLASALRGVENIQSSIGDCNKCKDGNLKIIQSRWGKQFVGCSNYPKCDNTYPLPAKAGIEPVGKTCEKCGTPIVKVLRKGRATFTMCLDPKCETKKNWASTKSYNAKKKGMQNSSKAAKTGKSTKNK